MGTGGEFRPPSGFLPAGEIGICCSTLRRQRPKGLCQRERGADALVSVVIEDREQGAIHRSSVGEDAHRSGAVRLRESAAARHWWFGRLRVSGLCSANRRGVHRMRLGTRAQ